MIQISTQPLLQMHQIDKFFGSVQVLKDVNLDAYSGEIVSMLGQNGAGKSTLMKILSGIYPRNSFSGEVKLDGEILVVNSLLEAESRGIIMIPQEVEVCNNMTVAETLYLGDMAKGGLINKNLLLTRAKEDLETFGITDIDPETLMGTLPKSQHQLILIAKAFALSHRGKGCKILILDEPTASLSDHESQLLFQHLKIAKRAGILCIYISHRLKEVFEISDRYAIMRDGAMIGIYGKDEITMDEAITLLTGSKPAEINHNVRERGKEILDVKNLKVYSSDINNRKVVNDVSFTLREGEVLGIYGLLGAGKTEIAMSLYGAWQGNIEGIIEIDGKLLKLKSISESVHAGVGFLPEDRRVAIMGVRSIRENMDISFLDRFKGAFKLLDFRHEYQITEELRKDTKLKANNLDELPSTLSGGNKQKILIARLLGTGNRIIIVDEPTVGVDVNARRDIYNLLITMAEKNHCAVIVFSSDLDEVLEVSDRIMVLSYGKLVASFDENQVLSGQVDSDVILKAAVSG